MKPDTKQHIELCLLDYMQKVPFHEITVAEICRRAGIARKTFYYHYPCVEDCFKGLMWRIMVNCSIYLTSEVEDYTDLQSLYKAQLNYWISQKPFLDCIARNDFFFYFFKPIFTV